MNEQRNALVALIDMDGTTADYDAALRRDLQSILSPGEVMPSSLQDEVPYMKERIRLIRNQPSWWRKLLPIPSGMAVVALLRRLGFSLNVLTKGPANSPNSWTEKRKWCREHIPDATVTITEDKSLVYGRILFDDWPAYAESWLKWRPRGWVIMPAHPWNATFQHPRVIRYDPTVMSLEELEKKISEITSQ